MTNLLDDERVLAEVMERVSNVEAFARFEAQGEACGWCRQPVRVAGRVFEIDSEGSRRHVVYSTTDEPDGALLVACGSRRVTRCPSCSNVYQGDARQLIGAGLRGGKGVPASVVEHPAIFATFTAPSFGLVHGRRARGGQNHPCHPAAPKQRCEHGRSLSCWQRHDETDPVLGEPLCAECFDYEAAVLWNVLSSELWRRTTIYLRRVLARLVGVSDRELAKIVRVSFAKVVEYQRRGVIHVHAVIRLDNASDDVEPPLARFDTELLALATRLAVRQVAVRYPHDVTANPARWGTQVDIRPITSASVTNPNPGAVANYIAKYATKSADASGVFDRRFRGLDDIARRNPPRHLGAMARTAWRLGGQDHLAHLNLQHWAHDLGHRGHWLTKSRRWSTTFSALRAERQQWRVSNAPVTQSAAPSVRRVGEWSVVGFGWRTAGDAYLAEQRQRQYLETRRLAREALAREALREEHAA